MANAAKNVGGAGSDRKPTPSAFMRSLRPYLYSDSVDEPLPPWDEAQFAHFLFEITSRKEEVPFERFARALVEAKICPNLLPQTGPTGGGDSKVDSETIPVADDIADRWYVGAEGDAREARWAFAFSAKRDWRAKLSKDCAAITSTRVSYKRIFFVTNQPVADKKRAAAEAAESKKINRGKRAANRVDVRILDATWIKDVMFDPHQNRWNLLEESFSRLEGLGRRYESRRGPEDAKALVRLEELDREIADPARFRGASHQLIDAWSTSAFLARRVGRPREEVQGRFDKALAIADEIGARRAAARVRYDLAWTCYWWFDDANAVVGLYDAIDAGVPDDDKNAWDLEQLTTLYSLLRGAELHGWLPAGGARLSDRAARLDAVGTRIASSDSRPTEAAWARTQLLFRRVMDDAGDADRFEAGIAELLKLLPEVEHLEQYPLSQLIKCVEILSDLAPNSRGLDQLAERTIVLRGTRAGAQAEAEGLLGLAYQRLHADRPYDAIKLLARAWEKLHRREARHAYMYGATLAAAAYASIGLHWAARAHLLLCLQRAFQNLEEDGALSGDELRPLESLATVELQLGRIVDFLQTERIVAAVQSNVVLRTDEHKELEQRAFARGTMLGALVLRSKELDLPSLQTAASVFRTNGQDIAAELVLFMLGDSEAVQHATKVFDGNVSALVHHPATTELPRPIWSAGDRISYSTYAAGCRIVLGLPNTLPAKCIGEAMLAVVEAFLATAMLDRIAPSTDLLQCFIEFDDSDEAVRWSSSDDDEGLPLISIRFGKPAGLAGGRPIDFVVIAEAVSVLIAHASLPGDDLARLWKDDKMHDRAFALLSSIAASVHLYSWQRLNAWGDVAAHAESSPYLRHEWWTAAEAPVEPAAATEEGNSAEGSASRSKLVYGEFSFQPNHREIANSGLVQVRLWDMAGWRGFAFQTAEDPGGRTPGFALLVVACTDSIVAAKIHRGLLRRLGEEDVHDRLRISILTGIDRRNPAHYRVTFGPNVGPDASEDSPNRASFMATRIHTMEPETSTNLDRFWRVYSERRSCGLVVAGISDVSRPSFPEVQPILIHNVIRREAWQVGPDDIDRIAILADDQPIIPEGARSQIAEVLRQRRLSKD